MWLDDDGEEPESGSFPDPSTRSWRHPSEIAAENARAAAAAQNAAQQSTPDPTAVLATASASPSIFWPITVVGGCIAVAALGVFGLYLTGASTDSEVIASAATTVGEDRTIGNTLDRDAAALSDVRESESLGSNGGGAVTSDGGEQPDSIEDQAEKATTTTTALPTTTTAPIETTTSVQVLPSQPDLLAGPTLYATADLDPGHLASVAMVDQFLITSASAVHGYEKLSLRVSGTWFDATIVYRDAYSDVALVVPTIPVGDLNIPATGVGGSVIPGSRVYLGYCESDGDPEAVNSELGCSPPVATLGDEALPPDPPAAEPDREDDLSRRSVPREQNPYGDNGSDPENDSGDEPDRNPTPQKKQSKDLREGTVYSMSQTLRTLTDNVIYGSIRTEIPQRDGVAGSPLRDPDGRIVGLVVGSSSPSVAAVPIDRALAVVQSFVTSGVADPAWLGIDGYSSDDGVVVTEVDEASPAFGLIEPGDLLDTIGREKLTEYDHLVHVVRQVGPGGDITLWVSRGGVRIRVDVTVGSAPLP